MGAKLNMTITESAVDTEKNTSLVTVKLTISWTSGSYNLNNKSGYITIDGTKYTFSNSFNDNRTTSGSKTLATKSKTVTHDTDGSKTVSCKGYYQTGTSVGNITCNNNKVLTSIPRNTVLGSIPNFIFDNGNSFDVPILSYTSTYYNVLQIKYNNATIANREDYTGNTITLTPEEINIAYSLMKTCNTAEWDFTLVTYSDNTKTVSIGTESTQKGQASISSNGSAPTFNDSGISAKDINTDTLAITNNENIFIKGFSTLEITLNNKATANKQAILGDSAYSFLSGSLPVQYANQSVDLPIIKSFQNVNNEQYTIIATDSRSNSTAITKAINMLNYSKPAIASFTAKRVQPALIGETVEINCTGTFFTDNQITNSLTAQYRFKENSITANYSDYFNISIETTDNNFNITGNLSDIFNIEKSYLIEIKIIDSLDSTSKEVMLYSANPILDINTNNQSVAFGKVSELSQTVDIGLEVMCRKEIYDKYGSLIGNGVSGGVNTDDPNTTAEDILFTRHANCPDSARYWYIKSYSTQGVKDLVNSTGYYGKKQVAFGYAVHEIYQRYYYSNGKEYDDNLWSEWIPLLEDYVAEQGTSGIWNYRKWNSGKAECWGTYTANSAMTTAWGNLYTSKLGMSRIDYPFTFTNRPLEQVTAHASNGACWVFAESGGNGVNTVSQTAVYNAVRPSSASAVNTIYLDFFITGYWK